MTADNNKKQRQDLVILIADDVASARRVVRKQLEKLGFTNCSECQNGKEALAKLMASQVDLIISDWEMPEMGGIDLLNKVREQDRFKDTPFVMITLSTERDRIIDAGRAGVTDYLVKPFSTETLEQKLKLLLPVSI